ncbi:MAG TPA: hypothetical protein VMA53_20750 [Stellaceae bacterium]|nr:hypothetical protein [Stellaceae bacterium]
MYKISLDILAGMSAPRSAEFFSSLDSKRSLALGDVLFILLTLVLLLGVIYSGRLFRFGGVTLLLLCWALFVSAMVNLPRTFRSQVRAFRREPTLRIDARGIWMRDWSSLGTVEWSDIKSISLAPLAPSAEERSIRLTLGNEEKYWKRLHSSEKLAIFVAKWTDKVITFLDTGRVAWDQRSPTSFEIPLLPIAQVAAVINPLLQTHGLPPLQERDPFHPLV